MLHKDNNRLLSSWSRGIQACETRALPIYRAKEPTELQRPSSKVALGELACVAYDKSLASAEATVEF